MGETEEKSAQRQREHQETRKGCQQRLIQGFRILKSKVFAKRRGEERVRQIERTALKYVPCHR